MARKQKDKKLSKSQDMRVLQTFYINCNRSKKEADVIDLIKDYMEAKGTTTALYIMCEAIEEFLPKLIDRENRKKARRKKAS